MLSEEIEPLDTKNQVNQSDMKMLKVYMRAPFKQGASSKNKHRNRLNHADHNLEIHTQYRTNHLKSQN